MESLQVVYMVIRLTLVTLASFFALMLWSRARDIAWMLLVIAAIAAYVETVYRILSGFGISGASLLSFLPFTGIVAILPVVSMIVPQLPTVFFTLALVVIVVRKSRLTAGSRRRAL